MQDILSEALRSFPAAAPQAPPASSAPCAAAPQARPLQQPPAAQEAAPFAPAPQGMQAGQLRVEIGNAAPLEHAVAASGLEESQACSSRSPTFAAWNPPQLRPLSAPPPTAFPLLVPRRTPPPPPLAQPPAALPRSVENNSLPAAGPPSPALQQQQNGGCEQTSAGSSGLQGHTQASCAVDPPSGLQGAAPAAAAALSSGHKPEGTGSVYGWDPMSGIDRAKCERAYDEKVRKIVAPCSV